MRVAPGGDVDAAYSLVGRAVAALDGAYVCGPDVGTTSHHLDLVRAQTRWVNPSENDAGASTAAGVLAATRGVLRAMDGEAEFAGRHFLIEGLGSVGGAIASQLVEQGSVVAGWDTDERARARVHEVELVPPERWGGRAWDVWMPCALGGGLDSDVAAATTARAVCGSANNQLMGAAGDVLHRRGVLHVPDFLASAGAVIEGVWSIARTPDARAVVNRAIAAIEERTLRVFRTTRETGRAPGEVAEALARAALVAG
jgi:glutamate dehydrogenase/leucine dehydrogenase